MSGTLNQGKISQGEGKRSKKDKNPREKGNILGKYRENKAGRGVAGIRGKRETFQVNIGKAQSESEQKDDKREKVMKSNGK